MPNFSAKTIQIFLPNGDPRGVRIAEITTRIVRVIELPRSLVSDFLKMPEAQQVGMYILIGDSENEDEPKIYIGQSGNVGDRISSHNKTKDFWNKALIAVSSTNSLTQTHALYLEWASIKAASEAARYAIENGNSGSQPYTPLPLQADCQEILETIGTLIATLGFPVFVPFATHSNAANDSTIERFYCKASGADGTGLYTEEGFVVLKGSTGRAVAVPSFKGSSLQFRQKLIDSGVARIEGDLIVFQKDHLFNSPSMAAWRSA